MAVIPTGAIYKSLIFDGEDSRNYGVYITGEAVYNAPARDVEMVSIPGRNGSFALDKGRFENIEVSYPAGIFAETEADFAQAISDFRNLLCSRNGYVRLTDDYNPNEYRMAIYKSGLEVEPAQLKAGEFNIVFDCKPQRWLTSGETAQAVVDGETLTNPTLFGSSPLIRCNGYGTIAIGSDALRVNSVPIGNILLSEETSVTITNAELEINPPVEILRTSFNASNLNTGDAITLSGSYVKYDLKYSIWAGDHFTSAVIESESGESWDTNAVITSESALYFNTRIPPITFEKGTSATKTYYYDGQWVMTSAGGSAVEASFRHYIKVGYDGNNTIKLYTSTNRDGNTETYTETGFLGQINGNSTVIRNDDIYIDLDIGEAYFDDNTNANYAVQLPADLPTLAPGGEVISYDDTFSKMEITPRWWKI